MTKTNKLVWVCTWHISSDVDSFCWYPFSHTNSNNAYICTILYGLLVGLFNSFGYLYVISPLFQTVLSMSTLKIFSLTVLVCICFYFFSLMASQSARKLMFNSISWLNTRLATVAYYVVWYLLWLSRATDASTSHHGSMSPESYSCMYLVRNILPMTWWTLSSMPFSYGFFIVMEIGLFV